MLDHPHPQPTLRVHAHTHTYTHTQERKAHAHFARMLLRRWRARARALRVAKLEQAAREEAALLGCNAAIAVPGATGRRRGRSTLSAAAGGVAPVAAVLALRSAGEYDLLAQQSLKRRRHAEQDGAALGDMAPLPLPRLLATALAGALAGLSEPPVLHGSNPAAAVPPERLNFKLLISSGWSDGHAQPPLAPPPMQRAYAGWLRNKLALGINVAPPPGASMVPLAPNAGSQHSGQQRSIMQQQSWQQQQQKEQLLQPVVALVPSGAEVLTLLELPGTLEGRRVVLGLEVIDVGASAAAAAAVGEQKQQQQQQRSLSDPVQETDPSIHADGLFGGTSAVLVLASGPAPHEVVGAVTRLAAILEQLPAGAAVPVGVLSCSGSGPIACGQLTTRGGSTLLPIVTSGLLSSQRVEGDAQVDSRCSTLMHPDAHSIKAPSTHAPT